jgi:predicted metalloprotease
MDMKAQIATRIIGIALPIAVATSFVAPAEQAAALTPNQATPQGVVQALNADINYFWWWTFSYNGWNYAAPTKYTYYDGAGYPTQVGSGCGAISLNNSVYCALDHVIYFDINWNQSLINRYGDFGSAFVLIHEWSHHVDTIRPGNWFMWAAGYKLFAARELHADCLAGVYMQYLARTSKLAAGDLNEALAWLDQHGDPAGYAYSNVDAHGSAAQRRAWFLAGYNNYNIGTCDTVFQKVY